MKPVLSVAYDPRLALPSTRLTYLWKACTDINAHIEVFSQWLPQLRRMGDESVMEQILTNESVRKDFKDPRHIPIFNKCRIYARVILTSDLTLPGTTQLDPDVWHLRSPRTSSLQWPRVLTPNAREISIWKTILAKVFLVGNQNIRNLTPLSIVPLPQESFPTHPAPHLSLPQLLSRLPRLHQTLIGTVVFPSDDGLRLATDIAHNSGIGANDGSSIDKTYASFAVKLSSIQLLETHNENHNIRATSVVDGVPGFITSLRAECRGALSIFLLLTLLH